MRRRHRFLMAAGLLAPACSPAPAPVAHRASTGTTSVLHPLEPADEAIRPEPATTTSTTEAPTTTVTIAGLPSTTVKRTTTTFVMPEAETEESDEEWFAAQPGVATTGRAALLACIRSYESGGDYEAVSPSGQYRGAYQFDRPTWASVGGAGDPADASAAEQDMRAGMLIDRRGLAPWPTPSRRCG